MAVSRKKWETNAGAASARAAAQASGALAPILSAAPRRAPAASAAPRACGSVMMPVTDVLRILGPPVHACTTAAGVLPQETPMLAPVERLEVAAPLAGLIVPLHTVPDPVFAQKIVGDGVSLDPTSGELRAPVAGEIVQLHGAHHALTIRTDSGIEVLVHIGIDTVMLRGEGFTPLVAMGQRVTRGQPLIRFDVDDLARRAKSLLTQVIVANMDAVTAVEPCRGLVEAGAPLMHLVLASGRAAVAAPAGAAAVTSEPAALPNAQGLHARPAAVLAAEAKRFKADVRLVRGADEVNAKSVVAIMGLSTKRGDVVHLRAAGADAADAIAALGRLLADGCGEAAGEAAPAPPVAVAAAAPAVPLAEGELVGVSASPGLAVGTVVQVRQQVIDVREAGESPARERARLDVALKEARQQVETFGVQHATSAKAQILAAHRELLDDPDLLDLAIAGTTAGKSAGFAWRAAFTEHAARLEALDNPLLRERANDIRDI